VDASDMISVPDLDGLMAGGVRAFCYPRCYRSCID